MAPTELPPPPPPGDEIDAALEPHLVPHPQACACGGFRLPDVDDSPDDHEAVGRQPAVEGDR